MDILSHALWAGAAAEGLRRRMGGARSQVALAVAMGALPDIAQVLPVAAWGLATGDVGVVASFALATPATEPSIPDSVEAVSHHLHCALHSVPVAAAIGVAAWRSRRALLIPLVGWWLHIALDIPTHSQDYYAVPFMYPISYWGFDGVPWTNPWILAANCLALSVAYMWLWHSSVREGAPR